MESSVLMRQLLRTPASCRAYLTQSRAFSLAPALPHARFISTPTILRPSFWASMIPKPLKDRASAPKSRGWNPATPYIILSLLVGSQAIQILWLKQERAHSLRKAEAKIGVLKEVIERVQNGEDVNVEKVLGTGDAESEKEWAEVMKDIQEEEALFQSKKKRKALREFAAKEASEQASAEEAAKEQRQAKVESIGGVKFY
ncbi:uncharacterized protein EKO05_0004472 [Ascochyta rabiei]|uniref:Uncharacterized protein n=1 Tax=Didymella rabiei TaxID=5454 RepID=A0A163DMI6_DIDRA|nr:uncharacterized protein EKO05_0004472 [Ascochyta rabiei]KZM23256.1 hypothetical protein ST47_g5576 [Ascochyta rabiei]UPX13979.1 hypothetical protein EKO05_0004472 [Ascochyta rabiei]